LVLVLAEAMVAALKPAQNAAFREGSGERSCTSDLILICADLPDAELKTTFSSVSPR
jgi:hypothetical protein